MKETIFKWNDRIPIEYMRVEFARNSWRKPKNGTGPKLLRKLYAYHRHNDKQVIFKVVPSGGYQGSGKMLRAYRRRKNNMSQLEAAKMLGVSQPMIARYENGQKQMLLKHVLSIECLNGVLKKYFPDYKPESGKDTPANLFKFIIKKLNHEKVPFNAEAGIIFFNGRFYALRGFFQDTITFFAVPKPVQQNQKIRRTYLKEFRKTVGWTQNELGVALGVSRTLMAKYESGDRIFDHPCHQVIFKLSRGYWSLDAIKLAQKECPQLLYNNQNRKPSASKQNAYDQIAAFIQYIENHGEKDAFNAHHPSAIPAVSKPKHPKRIYLKEFRKKMGWAQKQLAAALGVSRTMMAKYESGERIFDHPCVKGIHMLNAGSSVEDVKLEQKNHPELFCKKRNHKASISKQSDEERFTTFIRSVENT